MRQIKTRDLPAFSKQKRDDFDASFYTRIRQDAARATYAYKGGADARDPRGTAKRIREALAANVPLQILNDIENGITLMMLSAGRPLSLDVPFETQYLYASQYNADFCKDRIIVTPEEMRRHSAFCRANMIVEDALDAFDEWKGGQA